MGKIDSSKKGELAARYANESELRDVLGVGLNSDVAVDPKDAERVRAWIAANPDELRELGELALLAKERVVTCATTWVAEQESVKRRMAKMTQDLGYETSNILEQMAITQVVLNWVRLYFLETKLSNATKGSHNREAAHYWDRRVTAAQGRYNQALTTLAKLRKLKLPDITAIQANVAYINAPDSPTELRAKQLLPARANNE